ncbi:5-dehydro-4-deoxyglucarate dehydratase [Streptomyces sp. T1317-0309]|nr:5-dehydro-4-deoxyglucarate dehydratase [Streptomyces sp. T1317-0309]
MSARRRGGRRGRLRVLRHGRVPRAHAREFQACVRAAVEAAEGRVPVVAGAGYGTALARRYAGLAEEAGADGLLAMLPILCSPGRRDCCGTTVSWPRRPCCRTIVYQRDNAVFTPRTVVELARTDGVIGFKDGLGDLDLNAAHREHRTDRGPGRLPLLQRTADRRADPARLPRHRHLPLLLRRVLLRPGDRPRLPQGTGHRRRHHRPPAPRTCFYRPFVELRARAADTPSRSSRRGWRLRGLDVGEVRPPLHEPSEDHVKQLARLIDHGYELLREGA